MADTPTTPAAGSTPAGTGSTLADNPNPIYKGTGDKLTYMRYLADNQTMYDIEGQLLRGTMSFSKDKLKELDPSYTGYTHVFVLRMPPVLTLAAAGKQVTGFDTDKQQLRAQMHCRNLKVLFEMGCTSYSGTPDLTLNTSEVNVGWSERSYAAPTTAAYDGKQFTLKVLETRGDPLRRGIEYYVSSVSDPNVKAAMMNGVLGEDGNLLDPTLANFTFSFMVVQTDQTMLNVQDISIWNNCIPGGIDRSTLDWEQGSVDIVQPRDVQFTGVYMPDTGNTTIRDWANKLMLTRLKYYRRYQDMDATQLSSDTWQPGGQDPW